MLLRSGLRPADRKAAVARSMASATPPGCGRSGPAGDRAPAGHGRAPGKGYRRPADTGASANRDHPPLPADDPAGYKDGNDAAGPRQVELIIAWVGAGPGSGDTRACGSSSSPPTSPR